MTKHVTRRGSQAAVIFVQRNGVSYVRVTDALAGFAVKSGMADYITSVIFILAVCTDRI
jgi:hypothetical protein